MEIVNFLLEKDCDPSERDSRGWNIYHLACLSPDNKRVKFVEYLLKTLPEELTRELMDADQPQPLMLAVKRGNAATARTILEFGIDPWGSLTQRCGLVYSSTLLQLQNADYDPCGSTPKGLPRETGPIALPILDALVMNIEYHLSIPKKAPPFDVEKQKIEIPKLRATAGHFARRRAPRGRLAIETARKNATEEEKLDPIEPRSSTSRTYLALRDAATARPGTRQLVHLADMQRSVRRNLARQAEGTPVRWSERSLITDEEDEETNLEVQRIAELKARSLFASGSTDHNHVGLYGEDKLRGRFWRSA
ncbi:hypothetical protein H4582DRAFT_2101229 [Lactarius indigo]|nr:hypothetical protein H4582DRAFT_2101229 [Lactarius indigo]